MVRPHNLSNGQEALLRAHSVPEYRLRVEPPSDGSVAVDVKLMRGEALYIEVSPVDGPVAAKSALRQSQRHRGLDEAFPVEAPAPTEKEAD